MWFFCQWFACCLVLLPLLVCLCNSFDCVCIVSVLVSFCLFVHHAPFLRSDSLWCVWFMFGILKGIMALFWDIDHLAQLTYFWGAALNQLFQHTDKSQRAFCHLLYTESMFGRECGTQSADQNTRLLKDKNNKNNLFTQRKQEANEAVKNTQKKITGNHECFVKQNAWTRN